MSFGIWIAFMNALTYLIWLLSLSFKQSTLEATGRAERRNRKHENGGARFRSWWYCGRKIQSNIGLSHLVSVPPAHAAGFVVTFTQSPSRESMKITTRWIANERSQRIKRHTPPPSVKVSLEVWFASRKPSHHRMRELSRGVLNKNIYIWREKTPKMDAPRHRHLEREAMVVIDRRINIHRSAVERIAVHTLRRLTRLVNGFWTPLFGLHLWALPISPISCVLMRQMISRGILLAHYLYREMIVARATLCQGFRSCPLFEMLFWRVWSQNLHAYAKIVREVFTLYWYRNWFWLAGSWRRHQNRTLTIGLTFPAAVQGSKQTPPQWSARAE